MHEAAVLSRHAAVADDGVKIRRVVVVVASARVVHLAQARHWQCLVLVRRLRRVRAVVVAVRMAVRIRVGPGQPETGEDGESSSGQGEWENASAR